MKTNLLTLVAAAIVACSAWAQEPDAKPLRPVTSSYMVEVGSSRLADTYLTPLHYTGLELGVLYQRAQAMRFDPERWMMQLQLGANLASDQNPAKNATMVQAMAQGSWHMARRWALPQSFSVGVGPGLSADAGIMYLNRNGNNPASAKASITIDANAFAQWRGRVWRVPLTLRYQARLPLLGAFFSPSYGQLYYQIYMGDDSSLAHAAWMGNHFMIDNLLTADLHFGNTSVRVGYRGKFFSSKVNNLVTHDYTHALVLGITTEWISLAPGKKLPDAKIISAY